MAKKKKSNDVVAKIGVGAVAAAALAMAGGYVLWERMDKNKKAKVKTWVAKARKEAAHKVAIAKKMSEGDYKHIVDAAVTRYGSLANVNKAELQKTATTLKEEWKRIQGHAKTIAAQMQKKSGPAAKKAGKPQKRTTTKRKARK
jgi:uncharacterized iron-regulated protein